MRKRLQLLTKTETTMLNLTHKTDETTVTLLQTTPMHYYVRTSDTADLMRNMESLSTSSEASALRQYSEWVSAVE